MRRRLSKILGRGKLLPTIIELAGFAVLILAAWYVHRALGLAAAGLALIGIALALESR